MTPRRFPERISRHLVLMTRSLKQSLMLLADVALLVLSLIHI